MSTTRETRRIRPGTNTPGRASSDVVDLRCALQDDGFARLRRPVLTAAGAEDLRSQFFELHGAVGLGWHNSFNSPDLEYRSNAWAAIEAATSDELCRQLPGYEPFHFVYLCKWPGDDSYLYWHQDWMYIDERRGERAFAVMVALDDIGPDNGQVRVVPGSHRLERNLRGTDLHLPWGEYDATLTPESTALPLAAGRGAVWDAGIVHYSETNRTQRPRLAVAVGMKPTGADLVHFLRVDDHTAAMFSVDREFFERGRPEDLAEHSSVETIPVEEWTISEAELANQIIAPQESPRTRCGFSARRLLVAGSVVVALAALAMRYQHLESGIV